MDCQLMAKRTPGAEAVGEEEAVGAIRVSANGWEGFIMEGFEPLLRRSRAPPVIAVEWNPAAMRLAGYADPLSMVQRCAGGQLGAAGEGGGGGNIAGACGIAGWNCEVGLVSASAQ
jgi:hypothetical protein